MKIFDIHANPINNLIDEEGKIMVSNIIKQVIGIDAWGWDRPFDDMVAEFKAGNKKQFWESHYLGKEHEYCHIERLANLDKIPRPYGFRVSVFPIKIEGASAGWVRAVAILED